MFTNQIATKQKTAEREDAVSLERLIEMGIVEHIGRKMYVLARSLYAATGKSGMHTRHVGLDRDTNKELLLKAHPPE